jgi:hypothetical protein
MACNLAGRVGTCTAVASGQDPDSECMGFSCAAYYDSFSLGRCYGKQDVNDSRAACNGSGACLSAGTLCPDMLPGAVTLTCNATCQTPAAATCTGTTAGRCDNLDDAASTTTCGYGPCQRTVQNCVSGLPVSCVANPAASSSETCNGIDDNCDGVVDNGTSVALCPRPTNVTTALCSAGACVLDTCVSGYADCDHSYATGCETPLNTLTNCASCGTGCALANATATCGSGTCAVQTCDTGWGNCDGVASNGCETRLDSLTNCGGCNVPCALGNASESCASGSCQLTACDAGWGNCNTITSDGCERAINTLTDCGGCGVACAIANAAESCSTGTCVIGACTAGYGNCDTDPTNGCETRLNSVVDCAACGVDCALANATESCTTGSCVLGACTGLYRDCNGNPADGCERPVNTLTDCGGCNVACGGAGTYSCATGTCLLDSCAAGMGNCDGNAVNGCEARLDSTTNCGGCAVACVRANAAVSCPSGACTLGACNSGYGNCDGDPSNGCETALNTVVNCGTCGTICNLANATEACTAGACAIASCSSGWANCDANPVNGCETQATTLTNCGGCGVPCARDHAAESCGSGTCALGACDPGWGNCDGNDLNGCETPLNTLTSCGGCGIGCAIPNAGASCATGSCALTTCTVGYGNCDGGLANGCETALTTLANCGGCGAVCARANAAESCTGGTCTLGACDPGYGNCDGDPSNGCEAPLNSLGNCGGCGTVCDRANAAESCPGGVCTLGACAAGYGDCNGLPNDGCEAPLTSATNCAGCGLGCAPANASGSCSSGSCLVTSCSANFYDVDGTPSNGCECQDDGNASVCSSAGYLGTVAPGTSASASGKTPAASSPSDWFYVDFPTAGSGTPTLALTVNDGNIYRFDVQLTDCAGGSTACSSGSSVGLDTWTFTDNASPGYTMRGQTWPARVYVRVFRITSGQSCAGFTLTASR